MAGHPHPNYNNGQGRSPSFIIHYSSAQAASYSFFINSLLLTNCYLQYSSIIALTLSLFASMGSMPLS